MNKIFDVAIVGGGASGLLCACECAKRGKSVVVIEASDRVAKKIAASGNGRCNLTNSDVTKNNYNTDFVDSIVGKFSSKNIIDYFASLGLLTAIEDGRVYPLSRSATSVINILLLQLSKYRVLVMCDSKVIKIEKSTNLNKGVDNVFCLDLEKASEKIYAVNTVVCCGSRAGVGLKSYKLLEQFGHNVTTLLPALAPLKCDSFKGASGVRANVKARLEFDGKIIAEKEGEFLFKDNALSGVLAFELSSALAREINKENNTMNLRNNTLSGGRCEKSVKVVIDFAPSLSEEDFVDFLGHNTNAMAPLSGVLHKALSQIVLSQTPMDRSLLMNENKCRAIAKACKNCAVDVQLTDDFSVAQVCVGGLDTQFFDNICLESKLVDKLFACGEALNVDGDCGGYNLHWAWASALAVAEKICK